MSSLARLSGRRSLTPPQRWSSWSSSSSSWSSSLSYSLSWSSSTLPGVDWGSRASGKSCGEGGCSWARSRSEFKRWRGEFELLSFLLQLLLLSWWWFCFNCCCCFCVVMEVVALEQDVAQSSNAGEVGRDLVWIVVLFAAVVVISPGDDLVVFLCCCGGNCSWAWTRSEWGGELMLIYCSCCCCFCWCVVVLILLLLWLLILIPSSRQMLWQISIGI